MNNFFEFDEFDASKTMSINILAASRGVGKSWYHHMCMTAESKQTKRKNKIDKIYASKRTYPKRRNDN